MAILQAQADNSSGFQIDELAPSGDFVATCLDVSDEFQVTRRKYQSEETEQIDVTRFLFGFKAADGKLYKIQTFEMKISGSPKSTLYKFLSAWLGKAPAMGWDYCEMIGKGSVIKVEQTTSAMGTTYSKITSITPPKTALADYTAQVTPVADFGHSASTPAPAAAPAAAPVASAPSAFDPNQDENCPF